MKSSEFGEICLKNKQTNKPLPPQKNKTNKQQRNEKCEVPDSVFLKLLAGMSDRQTISGFH